ncbi:glycosyltransferase [Candidatus Beckwithbacteria bacterium]|nr:glycosyltransferase [Candidatus Beckwithbacteria bacterium]
MLASISIIIPVKNEQESLPVLIPRLLETLQKNFRHFEIIVVNDHSTDKSLKVLKNLNKEYPFKIITRKESSGKGKAVWVGIKAAKYQTIGFIDADLAYPPEIIPELAESIKQYDLVIGSRKYQNKQRVGKKLLASLYKFIFGTLLFNLQVDIQSGIKVFKKKIIDHIEIKPGNWSFDLEFVRRSVEAGFSIGTVEVPYHGRQHGNRKSKLFSASFELLSLSIWQRLHHVKPLYIDQNKEGVIGYKRRRFTTHTQLELHQSAITSLKHWQKLTIFLILASVAVGICLNPIQTLKVVVAILSSIYFIDVLFNLYLILKSLHFPPEISVSQAEIQALKPELLPIYTILCPLYKEAHVLPHFLKSIAKLDWPKDKLDVQLLLEEDDRVTIEAAEKLNLPDYVRIIVVPHSQPKTKPKACNYGLKQAIGEFLVIYDAEDQPDPLQLKKAYLAFNKASDDVKCLQAKLNYYNPEQNILTRLFTAEYSLWFDITLSGLQSIDTTIPLGGTSNHFRTQELQKLQGWDAFNVTEDCDLGVRLFKEGFKTAMIDSTTLEEANSKVGNWFRQRSRWIKGYIQTYFVHMRHPVQFVKNQSWHAFIFQLVVGGKIAFMLINPILWLATIAYFSLYAIVGPTIESLYPASIFYMAMTSLIFGNFLFIYYYMIGCAKREQWQLVKFVFLIPVYWLMVSLAAVKALWQFIVKPYYWEKTIHGLHLGQQQEQAEAQAEQQVESVDRQSFIGRRFGFLISTDAVSGGILVAASMLGNVLNFLYNAYLSRTISLESFGLVSLMGNFLFLSAIPLSGLSRTITNKSAYYFGKYQTAIKSYWAHIRSKVVYIGLALTALWLLTTPFLSHYFNSSSVIPFILFTPIWFIGTVAAVDSGYLSGILQFKTLAFMVAAEATSKLVFTVLLVQLGFEHWVYMAIPLSMAVSFLVGWYAAKKTKEKHIEQSPALYKFPVKFFSSSVLLKFSSVAFLSFDVILAKHYLSPSDAGHYALVALVGKMIYMIGSLFSQFVLPIVSKAEGESKASKPIFYKLFYLSSGVSLLAYLFVGLLGKYTTPLLLGSKIVPVVGLLPIYGIAIFYFTVANIIATFHQARNKHLFPTVNFMFALVQIFGIVLFHSSVSQIVWVMAIVGLANLSAMAFLHIFADALPTIWGNITDFLGLFLSVPAPEKKKLDSYKILIFNWRDTKHIWAGGAEVYVHEIAKQLVEKGHTVTVFCGNDHHNPKFETIDGVHIVRRGGFYTVYIWAFFYYLFRFKGKYDVIIDGENGIPFFTPLYAKEPIVGLVHHVHQEVFRKNLNPFSAMLATFLESQLMPWVYRNVEMITVSESSKKDMIKIGLGKKHQIAIINPGVTVCSPKNSKKTSYPSILYLGRLKAYKSIDTLIEAMVEIKQKQPKAKLTIAGFGEHKKQLKKLVKKLHLQDTVSFVGKVSEEAKYKLLTESWVFAYPSSMEGWGISVIEANACGTPVVAANVPGLRDSVSNPHTGYLVPHGDSGAFAQKITQLLTKKKLRTRMEQEAQKWAGQFSWDKSSQKLIEIIKA